MVKLFAPLVGLHGGINSLKSKLGDFKKEYVVLGIWVVIMSYDQSSFFHPALPKVTTKSTMHITKTSNTK